MPGIADRVGPVGPLLAFSVILSCSADHRTEAGESLDDGAGEGGATTGAGGADYDLLIARARGDDRLWGIRADGSGLVNLQRFGAFPSWSPDGRQIVFEDEGRVWTMNADGSDAVSVVDGQKPTWSPNGTRIAYQTSGSAIWVMLPDGSAQEEVVPGLSGAWTGQEPVWSPDSALLAFTGGPEGTDVWVAVPGDEPSKVSRIDATEQYIAVIIRGGWSPNSEWLVFAARIGSGEEQLYAARPSGEDVVQLTTEGRNDNASWAPAGGKIAFVSDRDGNQEVYVMNEDGSEQTNLSNDQYLDHKQPYWTGWSPDGTRLAFESARGNGVHRNIYIATIASGLIFKLADSEEWEDPIWRP